MGLVRGIILTFISLGFTAAFAAAQDADVKGSKDHPLISRFPGSRIIGYMQKDWDQTRFPLSNEIDDNKEIKKPATVEGKIIRIVYVAPAGKSPLEVHRNYEQALLAAGIIRKFGCERNCGQLFWAWRFGAFRNSLTWSDSGVKSRDGSSSWNSQDAISDGEGRCLYGTLKRGGQEIHVRRCIPTNRRSRDGDRDRRAARNALGPGDRGLQVAAQRA
jgi:OmpA-OmpF porin, OOP family